MHKGLVEGVQGICLTILDQKFCQVLEELVEGRLSYQALSHHLDPLHNQLNHSGGDRKENGVSGERYLHWNAHKTCTG